MNKAGRVFSRNQRVYSPSAILMNLTVYPLIVLWTLLGILLFPPAFLGWKLVTRWDADRIMRHFIWIYGRVWMLILSPFVRFERQGLDQKALATPAVLVVNHLSFFDTYCMAMLPVFDISFAVRAWPFKMFFYAFFMRLASYLDVESFTYTQSLQAGDQVFRKGGSVLFFPEGHRSRTGDLQRFYSGAFRMAVESKIPVVPLCITGTDTLLPPGRYWLQPAKIVLRALPAVSPSRFEGPAAHILMRKEVKQMMTENLEELRG